VCRARSTKTAFLDGYSFPRFFLKILVPLIASGIGVAAVLSASCFPGSNCCLARHADVSGGQADFGSHDAYRFRGPAWIGACWPRPAF